MRPIPRHVERLSVEMERPRPPRVVVAEDDHEMRRLIVRELRKDGYTVLEAGSGTELMEIVRATVLPGSRAVPVDLIVSDLRMPGCSGLEVLAGLRNIEWAMPVILITAFGSDETHSEAERLGAAEVFDKPFDIDELRLSVFRLLGPA